MISSRFVLSWTRIQFSHDLSVSLFKKIVAFDLDIPISIRNYSLAIKIMLGNLHKHYNVRLSWGTGMLTLDQSVVSGMGISGMEIELDRCTISSANSSMREDSAHFFFHSVGIDPAP